MGTENAIEVCDIHKHFKVYKDKGHMLRERIVHWNRNKYETREVLKGISFAVKKGESVGLIGKNGCGKSTTLKLLTRILRPNSGTIDIEGRVCSLIELGAGFHPDMSGRENIYINASIFGIKAKEVDKRLNDIIRFSELEEFIDNPVRTYSSGMYMRLAFSVAINVNADILLIDEILAVGDMAFQKKCFNKLKDLKSEGVTIVIVSHALGQVEELCDRAIWIDNGIIKKDGPARKICEEYLNALETERLERMALEKRMALQNEAGLTNSGENQELKEIQRQKRNESCRDVTPQCAPEARREGRGEIKLTKVHLRNEKDEPAQTFSSQDIMKIEIECDREYPEVPIQMVVELIRKDGVLCFGTKIKTKEMKPRKAVCTIDQTHLCQGDYYLDVKLINIAEDYMYDGLFDLIEVHVEDDQQRNIYGVVNVDVSWKVNE